MENNYKYLHDAIKIAEQRVDGGYTAIYEDSNGERWLLDNYIEMMIGGSYDEYMERQDEQDGYYCVGWDGSIGYTEDDGYNVQWLLRPRPLISLREYAALHNVTPRAVRGKIARGSIHAQKIGRDWVIDADEPYTDRRYRAEK